MHWNNTEELAKQLEEAYCDEDIPEYNVPYIKEMVLSLPNFEDHEIEVGEEILEKIMECWMEVRG